MKLRCQYASETGAEQAAKKLYRMLQQYKVPELIITPPTPAFYEKVGGNFRWQIVIKSKSRSELKKLLPHIPPAKWQVDIDPQSLL
jgi:primosomal protein N'